MELKQIGGGDIIGWLISLFGSALGALATYWLGIWTYNKLEERDKKIEKRLEKEITEKNNLEKERLKSDIESWKQAYSREKEFKEQYYKNLLGEIDRSEKSRKEYEEKIKKLINVEWQLKYLLMWSDVNLEEIKLYIKEDVSLYQWLEMPEIIKIKEEIRGQKWEKEEEIINLRKQLKEHKSRQHKYENDDTIYCGIPYDEHDVNDKTRRKESISEVEDCYKFLPYKDENKRVKDKTIDQILPKSWKNDFESKSGSGIVDWKKTLIKMIEEERGLKWERLI